MDDLTDEPDEVVAAERSRVATEGWGARLLALQGPDGGWGIAEPARWGESAPGSTTYALMLLRDMGLDPTSAEARRAVTRIREGVTHFGEESPFFAGETEPCINGMVLGVGATFGEADDALLERLLSEQLEDGGWNCEAPPSTRSSFHTTICVLEGLLAYEQTRGPDARVAEARARGEAYLLERRMLHSLSTGEVIDSRWTRFAYPPSWRYDVLRGLDHMRMAGVAPDDSVRDALDNVEGNRLEDGRWALQERPDDVLRFDMGEMTGKPSRWNTLRALRVLRWAGRSS